MHKCAKTLIIGLALLALALPAPAQEYVVGENDVLKITVYGHKDLDTVERVSGEGMISFPLVGEVKVAGLPVSYVSKKIATLLSDGYIVQPQVSVFVVEFRSQKAVIVGEVVRPGLYELKGTTSFLEIISLAGGLTKDAADTAVLKRRSLPEGREDIITIDMKDNASLGITIIDGDNIFISRAGMFYVTGEVKKPDVYKYTEGTTVIKAITMAGGFSDKASPKKVRIIRKVEGREVVLYNVTMDETVMPDDVLVVPESFF